MFIVALGNVARARGMTKLANDSGLGRESLYKALAPGAKPRYEVKRGQVKRGHRSKEKQKKRGQTPFLSGLC